VVGRGGVVVELGVGRMPEEKGEFVEACVLNLFYDEETETCKSPWLE